MGIRPGQALIGVVVLCGLLLGACGGGDSDAPAAAPATTASTTPTPVREGPRSAPRWETVTTLSGTGAMRTAAFEILPDAIQWRARWTCASGTLTVLTDPPPRKPKPLIDAPCTEGSGTDHAIHTGSIALDVTATAGWEIAIDQQIDFPLDEPPLAGMDAGAVVAQGSFYDLENKGKGTARLYQLPDGALALRFEDFEVTQNTDLFIWVSESTGPKNSADAVGTPYVQIGNLRSTAGNQNYLLPAGLPAGKARSIVIWCAPVSIAYAAAPLAAP